MSESQGKGESDPNYFKINEEAFKAAFDSTDTNIGRLNVAVFGATGVGKSTLVNTIFGESVARTGVGKPVTSKRTLHKHESGVLGIFDGPGVELGQDAADLVADLRDFVSEQSGPLEDRIHVVWFCIGGRTNLQSFQEDFIREVHQLGLPVICVLTQVDEKRDGAVRQQSKDLYDAVVAAQLPIVGVPVMLACRPSSEMFVAHGVDKLLDVTRKVIPDACRAAFDAAQWVDWDLKRRTARGYVTAATVAAGASSFIPIPGADITAIVATQAVLLDRISHLYDVQMETSAYLRLLGPSAMTLLQRTALASVAKFVPFGDAIAGPVIATVASAATAVVGFAWITTCERIARGEVSNDYQSAVETFSEQVDEQESRLDAEEVRSDENETN